MDCKEALKLMDNPGTRESELLRHCTECAACAREMKLRRAENTALAAVGEETPPPGLDRLVLTKLSPKLEVKPGRTDLMFAALLLLLPLIPAVALQICSAPTGDAPGPMELIARLLPERVVDIIAQTVKIMTVSGHALPSNADVFAVCACCALAIMLSGRATANTTHSGRDL
jgi:hypothetical protein